MGGEREGERERGREGGERVRVFQMHLLFHHSGNQKINFDPINVSFTSDQPITSPLSLHTRHIHTSLQRELSFVPLSNRMP